MCTRTSGLFCACLLVSCVMHSGRCSSQEYNHNNHSQSEHHSDDTDEQSSGFLITKELFHKYGHNGLMTFDGFHNLLKNLGLIYMIDDHDTDHDEHSHTVHNQRRDAQKSESTISSDVNTPEEQEIKSDTDILSSTPSFDTEKNGKIVSSHWDFNLTAEHRDSITFGNKCLTASEILHIHNVKHGGGFITPVEFRSLCPAIIYQLDQHHCAELDSSYNHKDESDHSHLNFHVWLYATLSVLVISLCGLFSVAIIPVIQKRYYHVLLQFLIGMAVGSLSGDSLLHLLPHAMISGSAHEHHHEEGNTHPEVGHIWKSLAALAGVYLFFFAERILSLFTSYHRMKQSAKAAQVPKLTRALTRVDGEHSKVVGEKLSHHKHGSYGYKFDQATLEALQKLNEIPQEEKDVPQLCDDKQPSPVQTDIVPASGDGCIPEEGSYLDQIHEKSELKVDIENNIDNPSSSMKSLHVDVTYSPSEKTPEPETPTEECHRETVVYRHAHDDHSYVVTVTDHHHHHHHHHNHSHEVPSSVSSVAWMVVMGDGLHNFSDGLAIGTAFSTGMSGGLSTTIAVFCHELPHELGDFAMLLKAGMTVKQALFYNGLSSILCLFGMLIGVGLGNVASATSWIFAGAAGMFLYIALVDMLPELGSNSSHPGTSNGQLLAVQLGGITLGIVIMILIAIYEHDLQKIVS